MMVRHPLTEERRRALCAWLEANGINPRDVPLGSDIDITTSPDWGCPDGDWVVRYEVYVRDPDTGNVLARRGEDGDMGPVTESRTTPLRVGLPKTLAWLQPGDEYLPLHREEEKP